MILIEMPECKLFEKIDRSDKEEGEMVEVTFIITLYMLSIICLPR